MASAPLRPTTGTSGILSSTPLFSANPMMAAVMPALSGVTPPDETPFLRDRVRPRRRTIGAALGAAILMVGIDGVARTIAVWVLRAMPRWYHPIMSTTTDALLQALASQKMAAAEATLSPQIGADPVPPPKDRDDFWDSLSSRGKEALRKYHQEMREHGGAGPTPERLDVIKSAASNVRGAVSAGLNPVSSASDSVRDKLRTVAGAAGALMIGASLAPLLLPLIVFLLIEQTGYGQRARSSARRYVSGRARAYGF